MKREIAFQRGNSHEVPICWGERIMGEFDVISDEGLFMMTRDNLNLIRALVDEAQRKTAHMGFIEHHGEIRVKVSEIKPILKEIEKRFANHTTGEGDNK